MNLSHAQLLLLVVLAAFVVPTIMLGPTAIWCTFSFGSCTLFTITSLFSLSCNCFKVFAFLNFRPSRFRCFRSRLET